AIVDRALALGARQEAPGRSLRALEQLLPLREALEIVTCAGDMGEREARSLGFDVQVISQMSDRRTTGADTEAAAKSMLALSVELLLFAGGDGTARDVFRAVGHRLPVIGIPAGVKIHSGVYANTPAAAGQVARKVIDATGRIWYKETEVMDIDEEAFRENRVSAKLYGYMKVPYEQSLMQSTKAGSSSGEIGAIDGIASHIIEHMELDRLYLFGPGTTTRGILEKLGLNKTLLGVDALFNQKLIARDLTEEAILRLLGRYPKASIVVTVIGGQGFIFGRGNQQLSHRVIHKTGSENIIIAATETKMLALEGQPLRVDTGNLDMDRQLTGYRKVVTGLGRYLAFRVSDE
ncbi:MAG: ATP-NAD kinase family protein, partial [Bacillota bacterium]|nr:ATP-NAD kinase family protein [Bacillota bacterium]